MPLDPSANRFLRHARGGRLPGRLRSSIRRPCAPPSFGWRKRSTSRTCRSSASRTARFPEPAGPLPIRIYTPMTPHRGLLPGLIYFHGGAFGFSAISTLMTALCRMLANDSGCRVVSVGIACARARICRRRSRMPTRPPPGWQSMRARSASTRAACHRRRFRRRQSCSTRMPACETARRAAALRSRCCSARSSTLAATRIRAAHSPRAFSRSGTTLEFALTCLPAALDSATRAFRRFGRQIFPACRRRTSIQPIRSAARRGPAYADRLERAGVECATPVMPA